MTKQRVTILGGGLSGLTTAFYLTSPEMQGRYDVTIYQLGWRLGGKCATGRNANLGDRIQEHGLHVFMGQYQNAFAMVQALYAETAKPPFPTWRAAFTQEPSMTLMETVGGEWKPWVLNAPIYPGTPGIDPPPDMFERIIEFIEWVDHHLDTGDGKDLPGRPVRPPDPDQAHGLWDRLRAWLISLLENEAEHLGRALLREAATIIQRLGPDVARHSVHDHHLIALILGQFRRWMQDAFEWLGSKDDDLRRFYILSDLGMTNIVGGMTDGLLKDPAANLDRVNQLDYKAWLRLHGATEDVVESAPVRSLYDLIFAYPEGNWLGDGDVEAGTMWISLMNTACYQGSIIWKFNTATADFVMVPFYDVLTARGVRFEFFSRVDALVPSSNGQAISSVQIGKQVTLMTGTYDPLRTLASGQRVWPDRPRYDQIVDGAALEASGANLESFWTPWADTGPSLTLRAGADYDLLVLAIPPAAHPTICAQLIAQKPAWGAAGAVQTVATQSLQTWLAKDQAGLGWTDPAMVGAFDSTPLDSWADISAVLETESWAPDANIKSEQIACGPLPCSPLPPPKGQSDFPAQQQQVVDNTGSAYLSDSAWVFWSKSFGKGAPPPGDSIIKSQYSRANIDPSERYTLSVAGSSVARMRTNGSTYANLFLAGDWIQNGQNLGSFEATTISGKLAARAISGVPIEISGVDALALTTSQTRAAGTLPAFVEYGGLATFPGPISLDQTRMWVWIVKGDRGKMQGWCQRLFDIPSGGAVRIVPLTDEMMISIVDIGQGRFDDAPEMGWSQEREMTVWVPAARLETIDGELQATKMVFAMPYLVLDNPVAIASGREIFGYLKQHGRITLPGDPGYPGNTLNVDLFSTAAYGENSQEVFNRICTLTPAGERQSRDVGSFADAAGQFFASRTADIERWHGGLTLGGDIIKSIAEDQIPMIFLKQFRDIADGTRACYQAVTETMGKITGFDALPHFAEYDMELMPLDSSPIATEFGIAPKQRVTVVELVYDMAIAPGTVLWQA